MREMIVVNSMREMTGMNCTELKGQKWITGKLSGRNNKNQSSCFCRYSYSYTTTRYTGYPTVPMTNQTRKCSPLSPVKGTRTSIAVTYSAAINAWVQTVHFQVIPIFSYQHFLTSSCQINRDFFEWNSAGDFEKTLSSLWERSQKIFKKLFETKTDHCGK